jgi:hypothetical protein
VVEVVVELGGEAEGLLIGEEGRWSCGGRWGGFNAARCRGAVARATRRHRVNGTARAGGAVLDGGRSGKRRGAWCTWEQCVRVDGNRASADGEGGRCARLCSRELGRQGGIGDGVASASGAASVPARGAQGGGREQGRACVQRVGRTGVAASCSAACRRKERGKKKRGAPAGFAAAVASACRGFGGKRLAWNEKEQ